MVEIGFSCEYCGDVLDTEVNDAGLVMCHEFHHCFGEKVGMVAEIDSNGVMLYDDSIEITML